MSTEKSPEKSKVRVAAVGDLHVHEKPAGIYRNFFTEVSKHADVVVLCGDLTTTGLPTEAENLAADLNSCTIPVLGVLGNHDHESGRADEVRRILRSSKFHLLEDEPFIYQHVGFAGVKGFCGGFNRYMLTSFGEEVIKRFVAESISEALKLENELRELTTEKTVVALHYSPITQTLEGEPPEIFPYLGSSRLAETIDRFDVSAVVHGHAHKGTFQGQTNKGIPVYNTCLELVQALNPEQPYALLEM
jgi:Icc-related predicted phosphoesterase